MNRAVKTVALPSDEVEAPRAQFSLRSLLLITTGVAVAFGIALALGWNTLPVSLGFLWSAINAGGMLRFAQHTPRARSRWIWAAWLLFLAALCLPVAKGCNNENIRGWEVSANALAVEGYGAWKVVTGQTDLSDDSRLAQGLREFYTLTTINLANLLLASAPLIILLFRSERGHYATNTLAVTAVLPWCFMVGEDTPPMPGYLAWCLCFAVITSARKLPWSVFALMAGHVALFVWLVAD